MPQRHHQTVVGTSAVPIEGTQYPGWVMLNTGTNPVFVGDETVTVSTGFPIVADVIHRPDRFSYLGLRGQKGERLYGVVASGTEDVRVLIEGRVTL